MANSRTTQKMSHITQASTISPKLTQPHKTPWNLMTKVQKQFEVLGPYPCDAPTGFNWVPNGWKLVATSTLSSNNTSFEEIFLEKIQSVRNKKVQKRSKLDFRAKVSLLRTKNNFKVF